MNNFSKEKIEQYIADGLLLRQWHPSGNFQILNYSQRVQWDKSLWDELTKQARGLILTKEYELVSRPFKKFFNLSEIDPNEIPNEPFEVYAKLDGSLAVSYWLDDNPFIATRGSFESDQSKKANEILYRKYSHTFDKMKRDRTYLWEILYPQNRIVCDYLGLEDLILLAVIDNETGKDLPLEDIGFPIVKRYDGITDIGILKGMIKDDEEGFVIRWKSGQRAKIKGDEYCRLHKILTQTSNIAIWENLRSGADFNELLERIPDEFFSWLSKTKSSLEHEYAKIESASHDAFKTICDELYDQYGFPQEGVLGFGTSKDIVKAKDFKKKDFALKVMGNPDYKKLSGILFNMIDGREYKDIIWKMIRPEYSKPFKNEIDA